MLCDTVRELIEVVRADTRGAGGVLCADRQDLKWIGFCVMYDGGTVTHSATLEAVKDWDGCPFVGELIA